MALVEGVKLKSVSLTEAAADELRRRIMDGSIKTGMKMTERDVAEMLGTGRMPSREALMALEHEGLITSRSEARYVLELTPERILSLYKVRTVLEQLAVTQAAENTTPERALRLEEKLKDLRFACERKDASLTTPADLALHEEIWSQSDNPYLEGFLRSMRGVVFLVVMQGSMFGPRDWIGLYDSHKDLVGAINSGDQLASGEKLGSHLVRATDHFVKIKKPCRSLDLRCEIAHQSKPNSLRAIKTDTIDKRRGRRDSASQ